MTIHAPNRTDKTLPLHLTGVWNGNNATTTLMIIDILIGQERYSLKVIDKHSEAESNVQKGARRFLGGDPPPRA